MCMNESGTDTKCRAAKTLFITKSDSHDIIRQPTNLPAARIRCLGRCRGVSMALILVAQQVKQDHRAEGVANNRHSSLKRWISKLEYIIHTVHLQSNFRNNSLQRKIQQSAYNMPLQRFLGRLSQKRRQVSIHTCVYFGAILVPILITSLFGDNKPKNRCTCQMVMVNYGRTDLAEQWTSEIEDIQKSRICEVP